MNDIVIQKQLIKAHSNIITEPKKVSRENALFFKKAQIFATFSQAALDLLQIPFYRNVKAAKQIINLINSQEKYEKLFKKSPEDSSLEVFFNKVHTVCSLCLLPIPTLTYSLSHKPIENTFFPLTKRAPLKIETLLKQVNPYALTALTILGVLKTAFSIKNLIKELKSSSSTKKDDCDIITWKHNSALVLCETSKLCLTIAKLVAPKEISASAKLLHNLTILVLSPLNAFKLYKQEKQSSKNLSLKQHSKLFSEIIKSLNICSHKNRLM